MTDCAAPQHARITGLGVPVGQFAYRPSRLHQPKLVVEIGECQWRSSHKRAVARSAASALVQRGRHRTGGLRGKSLPGRCAQDTTGLNANVFRVVHPLVPPPGEGVERMFLTQVRPGEGNLSDRNSHGSIVGPLAWLPAEAAAPHHGDLEFRAAGWAELVCGTQGITGCGAQQNAASAVKLSGSQCHEIESPFTH